MLAIIYNFTRAMYLNSMAVYVGFVGFNGDYWPIAVIFGVLLYIMLINVDSSQHTSLKPLSKASISVEVY